MAWGQWLFLGSAPEVVDRLDQHDLQQLLLPRDLVLIACCDSDETCPTVDSEGGCVIFVQHLGKET